MIKQRKHWQKMSSAVALLGLMLSLGACGKEKAGTGNTNWQVCKDSTDCPSKEACQCGVCAKKCGGKLDCSAEPELMCVEPDDDDATKDSGVKKDPKGSRDSGVDGGKTAVEEDAGPPLDAGSMKPDSGLVVRDVDCKSLANPLPGFVESDAKYFAWIEPLPEHVAVRQKDPKSEVYAGALASPQLDYETGSTSGTSLLTVSSQYSVWDAEGFRTDITEISLWTKETGTVPLFPSAPFPAKATKVPGEIHSLGGGVRSGRLGPNGTFLGIDEDCGLFRWQPGRDIEILSADLTSGGLASLNVQGTAAVGQIGLGTEEEAFLWTEASGVQRLGKLPNTVSSSGQFVVGDGERVTGRSGPHSFIWSPQEGLRALPQLLGRDGCEFTVPGGGSCWPIVVGEPTTASAVFSWALSEEPRVIIPPSVGLEPLFVAVSLDGRTIVGSTGSPQQPTPIAALHWSADFGTNQMRVLPGGDAGASASIISPDGRTIIGRIAGRAVRWVDGGEPEQLPLGLGRPMLVTGDGAIVGTEGVLEGDVLRTKRQLLQAVVPDQATLSLITSPDSSSWNTFDGRVFSSWIHRDDERPQQWVARVR